MDVVILALDGAWRHAHYHLGVGFDVLLDGFVTDGRTTKEAEEEQVQNVARFPNAS